MNYRDLAKKIFDAVEEEGAKQPVDAVRKVRSKAQGEFVYYHEQAAQMAEMADLFKGHIARLDAIITGKELPVAAGIAEAHEG